MSMIGTTRSQLLFWFALVAGTSYFIATRIGFQGADMTAWKGAGVGLLALWAARHAEGRDGWTIAAVLAFGAAGDVLLETHGLIAGAVAFLIGHLIAVGLYVAHRRMGLGIVAGGAVMIAGVAYAIAGDVGVAVYSLGLGAMAGAAWASDFPRPVAIGAALFVLSDLLIFARLGPLAGSAIPDWLVWPAYFAGQALIAHGVVSAQAEEVPDDDLHHRL
jgi:uncharacterized membrane protein YhhN